MIIKKTRGRPKTESGQKVHVSAKLYQADKDRARHAADTLGITVSAFVNQAVLEKLERIEQAKRVGMEVKD